MNIKELIEKLKQFDPETLVVVNGYEGGADNINSIEKTTIILRPSGYDGEYSFYDSEYDSEYHKDDIPIKAILLSRHEE
jgi:hypothetical protein